MKSQILLCVSESSLPSVTESVRPSVSYHPGNNLDLLGVKVPEDGQGTNQNPLLPHILQSASVFPDLKYSHIKFTSL